MNSFNVLWVGAEVGGVIDLVLEEDPRDFVGDEAGGLDRVVACVEEVVL